MSMFEYPLSDGTSGNAGEVPPVKKDGVQGKYWKVNYHLKEDESFESIIEILKDNIVPLCSKYIFAEEFGSKGETRHIEGGFITRTDRTRRTKILNIFKFSDCQKSQKRNWSALVKYCVKESNRIITNEEYSKPVRKIPKDILRPEQEKIVNMFKDDCPDPWISRGVLYWFWEPDGNWGKSITALYMVDHMGAMVVSGANNDILAGFKDAVDNGNTPRIVIFDIPRCCEGHVSYRAIEQLKSGFLYSPKYESSMCRFNVPHVVCFSNQYPDVTKMSEDRWIIKDLGIDSI